MSSTTPGTDPDRQHVDPVDGNERSDADPATDEIATHEQVPSPEPAGASVAPESEPVSSAPEPAAAFVAPEFEPVPSAPERVAEYDAAESEPAPSASEAAAEYDAPESEPVSSAPEPVAASVAPESEPVPSAGEPGEWSRTSQAEPVPEPETAWASDAPAEEETSPQPAEPHPVEASDAAARLDAAVERANAAPVASDLDDIGETDVPAPVAAGTVRRATYVPAATVAVGTPAGAATLAPEPEAVVPPVPQTIYVHAPKPKARGNRGFGLLVALIGTAVFALLYAAISYLLLVGRSEPAQANPVFAEFVMEYVFWVPVLAFFVGFAVLVIIVNRGPWWAYAVFGLLVGVLVYLSYIGASLLTVQAWTLTVDQASEFVGQRWFDPFAIVAAVVAREIPVWFGGWIASRGRAVAERNRLEMEAYDRELAAGPPPQRA